MPQTKKELEIRLVSVDMESKAGLARKTNNIVTCRLPWIRTGVELRDGSQTVKLESGHWSGANRPWHERIILKENVQGNCSLIMALSKPLSDSAVQKFAANSTSAIIKVLAALAEKASPTGVIGDFASIPLSALSKSATDTSAVTDAFAGSVDFNAADLPETGKTFTLEIPLLAKSDIRRDTERTTKGTTHTIHKTILKAGERAGTCVVEITVL